MKALILCITFFAGLVLCGSSAGFLSPATADTPATVDPPTLTIDGSSTGWADITDRTITLSALDSLGGSGSGLGSIEWQYCSDPSCTSGPASDNSYWDLKNDSRSFTGSGSGAVQLVFRQEGDRALRARACDQADHCSDWQAFYVRLDQSAPSVSMTEAYTAVAGVITLTGTATDTGSGDAGGHFELCRVGAVCTNDPEEGGGWTTIDQPSYADGTADSPAPCTATMSQTETYTYTCTFDTRHLTNGYYVLRFVASDMAGNTGYSVQTGRLEFSDGTVCLNSP